MYIRKNPDGTLDIVSDHGVVVQHNVPLIEKGEDESVKEGRSQAEAEAENPRDDQ